MIPCPLPLRLRRQRGASLTAPLPSGEGEGKGFCPCFYHRCVGKRGANCLRRGGIRRSDEAYKLGEVLFEGAQFTDSAVNRVLEL